MAMLNPYNYSKPKGSVVNRPLQNTAVNAPAKVQNGKQQVDAYLEQKVLSAKPEELTLMLYDGVVRFIKTAKQTIEAKDIEKTNVAIQKAEAIITELQATLNMDYDISTQLDSLYEYMNYRLLDANIQKSTEILDEVLDLAESMRDTWKEAMALV